MNKNATLALDNSLANMKFPEETNFETIDKNRSLPDNVWTACLGEEVMIIELSSPTYAHNLAPVQGMTSAVIMLHNNKMTGIYSKIAGMAAQKFHFSCKATQNHTQGYTVGADAFGIALSATLPGSNWTPDNAVFSKTFTTSADWDDYVCDIDVPKAGDYYLILFGVPQKEKSTGALVSGVSFDVSGGDASLELTPSPLTLTAGTTQVVAISYRKNSQPVSNATLSVTCTPANLFSGLAKSVAVSEGAGNLSVTAGAQQAKGTLTVTDPDTGVTQSVAVTVNAKQQNTDQLSLLAPTDHMVVTRQQTPIKIQYLDQNGTSLTGKSISVTLTSGQNVDIAPTSAVTKQGPDGAVYAEFEVNAQNDGELELTFRAPEVDDRVVSLTAGPQQQTKKLTVSPGSLRLPVDNLNHLQVPVTITPSQPANGKVSFIITPESGLYIVDGGESLTRGSLQLENNQAQIHVLKTGDKTDNFNITFSLQGYADASVTVTVDNGQNILMFPDSKQNNLQSPQRIETNWKGVPENFYIKVQDAQNKPVSDAKYQFILASDNQDKDLVFSESGTAISNICTSNNSGIISVPSITVGDNTGAFTLSVVSAASNPTTLGSWYFTVTTVEPIKLIKFESNLATIVLKPVTNFSAGENTVQAYVDSDGLEKAVSGQIVFTLSDKDGTGTLFTDYDADSQGLKKTVTVGLTGEADIPAFKTGTGGAFSITATATGLAINAITQAFMIKN